MDIGQRTMEIARDAGHRVQQVATSVYVALPVLMASAPSVAYGHETGQAHQHPVSPYELVFLIGGISLGTDLIKLGCTSDYNRKSAGAYISTGVALLVGTLAYASSH